MELLDLRGGINRLKPGYMIGKNQCIYMQNLRWKNGFVESIPGTIKYHGTTLGANPVTALLPYYDEDNQIYKLLCASGGDIFVRDEGANEFSSLKGALKSNQICNSVMRYSTLYIPHPEDGLFKYEGGNTIYKVGGGSTIPPAFKYIAWDKGTDRMFGVDDKGNIYWCDISDPENWDGASVDKIKFQDGETTEGVGILYGKLIIFCTYSIWIYYIQGNEENWRLEQSPTMVGVRAPATLRKGGKGFLFYSDSGKTKPGIYTFDGSRSELMTEDIIPLMQLISQSNKKDCAAEYHNDLYTFSFPYMNSIVNNMAIDLDFSNVKEDGTPAVYGPHDLGFRSSCVLSTRQVNGEFLIGDPSSGWVYREGGVTWKGANPTDGELIYQRFLSGIHNDGEWDTMKQYQNAYVYFRPTTYFQAKLRFYVSFGAYAREHEYYPQVTTESHFGDYDIFERRLLGSPELSRFDQDLGMDARGTSIQLEIINDVLAQRLAFQGYGYESSDRYKLKKCEEYTL
jgi:hypothetical protein